ncbi:3-oxoacyl-[acyl-carrier-protein] reductase FabG-like [Anneissia japonica]|uniref:3-oxoacyl-[acyl-carrier-protein] reductase FabG-like n=1 Tax=Anneissia japonica TaxID=1529436 RepID=UPI001425AB55|nr:3-oxoacyl-[acyl-carrier-protein] reductase FabG-like [Anneissia japonica]
MSSFVDKVALITGASSGIGAATALEFASKGCCVSLIGRNQARLESTARMCQEAGLAADKVLVLQGDMCNEEDVKRFVKSTLDNFGRLDILVNNAGMANKNTIETASSMETFDDVFNLNVRSVVQITNLAVPSLIKSKGAIVNVSSICGTRAVPNMIIYNMSKSALDQFTRVTSLVVGKRASLFFFEMSSFVDKVALITGASSGIGAATALEFASKGCCVSLIGRNQARLESTARMCQEAGLAADKVLVLQGDMCNEEDVKRFVKSTLDNFGRLDILVNNAGMGNINTIETASSMETFDDVFNLNVRSVVQITNLAVPSLIKSKGAIVNVSSICGTRAVPNMIIYNMSKSALDQFTRVTSLELAPKGVRVNSVNPGSIETPIHERAGRDIVKVRELAAKIHPLGRIGQSEEVAKAITFLASDDASFITGDILSVDGGRNVLCPR